MDDQGGLDPLRFSFLDPKLRGQESFFALNNSYPWGSEQPDDGGPTSPSNESENCVEYPIYALCASFNS